ncbi:amino acid permease [Paenibacillus nasutitermitis]|nr:amino acid permease [Paenibacillus nasutitermitis]
MALGLLLFVIVCVIALYLGIRANRGYSDPLKQPFTRHTGYVRFMQDKHELNQLGLAQQLTRRMSGFAAFGISFSTLSVIGAAVFLLGPAISVGGPAVVGFGFPILALFGIITACSLASFASSIPTAGGCYHWARAAGGRRLGLLTGWLHIAGNLLMIITMNIVCAEWVSRLIETKLGYESRIGTVCLLILFLFLTQVYAGLGGAGRLGRLFRAAAWLQALSVVAIVAGLAALAWPSAYPLELIYGFALGSSSGTGAVSGNEPVLLLGMLLLQRMFLGADSAAYVAEETHDPRANIPWAMFLSIVYTFIFGFVLFAMLLLQFPVGTTEFPLYNNMANWMGVLAEGLGGPANAVIVPVFILFGWGSGLGSMTACVRTLFALSRDGAVPWSGRLAIVSERSCAPVNALWVVAAAGLAAAIAVVIGGNGSGLTNDRLVQLVGTSLIALHLSYSIPIFLKLHGRRKSVFSAVDQAWQLGRIEVVMDWIAVIWLVSSACMTLYFLSGFIQLLVVSIAVILLAAIELYHKRPNAWKDAHHGPLRIQRKTIEEMIRIERRFPQKINQGAGSFPGEAHKTTQ